MYSVDGGVGLRLVAVFPLVKCFFQRLAVQAGRFGDNCGSAVRAACPALQHLPHLLLAGCLGKVVAAAVVVVHCWRWRCWRCWRSRLWWRRWWRSAVHTPLALVARRRYRLGIGIGV